MLSNIQVGSVNTVQNVESSSDTKIVNQEVKSEEKKSLCKGSGGMQLGGTGMKLKKPTKKQFEEKTKEIISFFDINKRKTCP